MTAPHGVGGVRLSRELWGAVLHALHSDSLAVRERVAASVEAIGPRPWRADLRKPGLPARRLVDIGLPSTEPQPDWIKPGHASPVRPPARPGPRRKRPSMNPRKLIDTDGTRPHPARVWNHWLGGKDGHPVDREVGDAIADAFPEIAYVAMQGRAFLCRAVRHLAGQEGVRQFLDIGAGLPTADNTHEVTQRVAPGSRVVYVDNDPLVLAHARALLAGGERYAADYVEADLRDPGRILAEAARTLDFSRPVAVMLLSVLPHIADDEEATSIVRRLMEAVPSGSFLVLSHETTDAPGGYRFQKTVKLFEEQGGPAWVTCDRDQVARFAEGLELVEPGVVWTSYWWPDPAPWEPTPVHQYALVARKP
ncbi:S-adenosyl methyltransferase [Thermomonospora echinospora]|uniref:S-adenosyl methyltransferase n=2 Tax=Thermomonospora echinospora TaxID=1992 RepID=A0A1H6D1B1_9ACTN|nr:SAM-dependent methyltransferase [Thermomonospora echinospora]SEG78987.1 S-adenosyl methyltransferase [Thermomonospora echinospora]